MAATAEMSGETVNLMRQTEVVADDQFDEVILAQDVLFGSMDRMRLDQRPEATTVWHACNALEHGNCGENPAMVFPEPPRITNRPGNFLMRLHPAENHVRFDPDGIGWVHMPGATSFRFSVVWSTPLPEKII